jgi:hypothetical protein
MGQSIFRTTYAPSLKIASMAARCRLAPSFSIYMRLHGVLCAGRSDSRNKGDLPPPNLHNLPNTAPAPSHLLRSKNMCRISYLTRRGHPSRPVLWMKNCRWAVICWMRSVITLRCQSSVHAPLACHMPSCLIGHACGPMWTQAPVFANPPPPGGIYFRIESLAFRSLGCLQRRPLTRRADYWH